MQDKIKENKYLLIALLITFLVVFLSQKTSNPKVDEQTSINITSEAPNLPHDDVQIEEWSVPLDAKG